MSAFQGLRDAFAARTVRERRMLVGLGVVLALVVGWYGVVTPALAWRDDATDRLATARTRAAAVEDGVARLKGAGPTGQALPAVEVEALAMQAAQASGLVLEVGDAGDGTLEFSIQSAASSALFGWLQTLEAQHGVSATALNVAENADATLQAQGQLKGQLTGVRR